MRNEVIIAGGGIAGLAAAVALTDAGYRVRVFEAGRMPGGRALSLHDETRGDAVDIGPHVLTSEHRNMLALLGRLGTAREIDWQPQRFITLVDDGEAIPMKNHALPAPLHFLPNFLRVRKLAASDILSARRTLYRVMRMNEADVLAMDDRDAESVLRGLGVSENFIDWFWRTVCMAIMNVPLEECSAGSLMRFLWMMSARGDFHFGFPRIPLGELFVPMATKLIERGGGSVVTGVAVRAVQCSGRGVQSVALSDGQTIETRRCVLALPPQALQGLRPAFVEQDYQLDRFRTSPYISTWLWFDRRFTEEKFWARIWSPDNLNYDFYEFANFRREPLSTPSLIGSNIIYSDRAAQLDDEAIIARTREELAEFAPASRAARLVHARVHRISMAICAPHPGFEARRPEVRTRVPGLYLAGDWLRTELPSSMESAVRSAYLAVEALAADDALTVRAALPRREPRGISALLAREKAAPRSSPRS